MQFRYLSTALLLWSLCLPALSGNTHEGWSYKKVVQPAVPVVKNNKWCNNPIDNFILAKIEAAHLSPAPQADKQSLIHRAYYDIAKNHHKHAVATDKPIVEGADIIEQLIT